MASKVVIIANPTRADVTVNAKVATKSTLTKLTLDDTAIADWAGWAAAGCSIGPYTNGTQDQRRQGGFLLARLQGLYP